jgi:hypothetical protein
MDNKYGRIFTEADVISILEHAVSQLASDEFDTPEAVDEEAANLLDEAVGPGTDLRLKFDKDEPLFILRGRDKRAIGAIKFYSEHQSPRAPVNHLDAIDKALQAFIDYRESSPGQMKEPD